MPVSRNNSTTGARHRFPGGRKFAFTVVDDTDLSTVKNVAPVYQFMQSLGMRTTKTVWPLDSQCRRGGETLEDPRYRDFVKQLDTDGFEIALHNVQDGSASRERIRMGLDRFAECFGKMPRLHTNHECNRDNLYWGSTRFRSRLATGIHRGLKRIRCMDHEGFGQDPSTPFFWGDLCQQHISYVRNLVFDDINLDGINACMPYHDSTKPWVNYWFSSCNGPEVRSFCQLISEANQDRLEDSGGVCIVYTHFALKFSESHGLDQEFARLLRRLSLKPGWFVPASELLDHLRGELAGETITKRELLSMDRCWLTERLGHALIRRPTFYEPEEILA